MNWTKPSEEQAVSVAQEGDNMANEKRLIDTEKCYCIAKAYHSDFEQNLANLNSLRELLDDCPTVDAVEVVHGRWVELPMPRTQWKYRCGQCGCPQDYKHNYCPNCGAKMDGDGNG